MTHVKFNYSNKEYNFALPLNTDNVQRIEIATNDNLFVVVVEMHKNLLKVYRVTEEIFEINDLVHTQPIKKAVLRATDFLKWYLDDHDTLFDLALDFTKFLKRNGKISLTAFDLFKNCGYIPKDICVNIMEDANADDEYNIEEILLFDDYQDDLTYLML